MVAKVVTGNTSGARGEHTMLVVKPNLRRMRFMRDSPSENGLQSRRTPFHRVGVRWDRVILAIGVAVVAAVGLIELVAHY
jgi:hypothetical protein